MDKLEIWVGNDLAGTLERLASGIRFEYFPSYDGPPVFLNLPVKQEGKTWSQFPPGFDGVLPEGVLLDQLLATKKLDRSDKWGQLCAVGEDLTGCLSVVPEGTAPGGSRISLAEKRKARKRIHPKNNALPYTWSELVTFHSREAPRMSLSGVQPKVSAVFSRKDQAFHVVEQRGSYMLKPSPQAYPEAAANEALSMALASEAGLDIPHCGVVKTTDDQPVFWIERFDRQGAGNNIRLRVEDACQLLEVPSSWKYHGNVETMVRLLKEYTSNPALQIARFFDRFLFNWVIGNGDMHLKNWSLLENGPLIELAPGYDFLNTALLTANEDESALALCERTSGFSRQDLIEEVGQRICGIPDARIERTLSRLAEVDWEKHIEDSMLSHGQKLNYDQVVRERLRVLLG